MKKDGKRTVKMEPGSDYLGGRAGSPGQSGGRGAPSVPRRREKKKCPRFGGRLEPVGSPCSAKGGGRTKKQGEKVIVA